MRGAEPVEDAGTTEREAASREGGLEEDPEGVARERALKLWVVLARAHASVSALVEADIARHGLTPGEFGALEALHHKGPLLLGQLQEKILLSSGGITYVVDRLEGKGLAVRRPCPRDRRASYAEITGEGKALMERIFPVHARAVARAVGGLDAQEQEEATAFLRTLGEHAATLEPHPGDGTDPIEP